MTYHIELLENGTLLKVKFGDPSTNTQIVQDAEAILTTLKEKGDLKGGPLIKVTGPSSMPVAFTLAHHLIHLYETVAIFDPKLSGYVVTSSHGPTYSVGDLIPES